MTSRASRSGPPAYPWIFGKSWALPWFCCPAARFSLALQRGLIDATEMLETSYDYTLGLHEVCKYRFGPPIHMSNNIFQLLIKPASWKALPDDLKAIVEKAAMAATFQGYADFWQETIEYNKSRSKNTAPSPPSCPSPSRTGPASWEWRSSTNAPPRIPSSRRSGNPKRPLSRGLQALLRSDQVRLDRLGCGRMPGRTLCSPQAVRVNPGRFA
jgi:hypothetical protein